MNSNPEYSVDDGNKALQALLWYLDEGMCFLRDQGHSPRTGSIADKELASFPRSETLHTAYYQGTILIVAASDHLHSFIRLLDEPVQTIAPYTCIRVVIETSAIASWILEPEISAFDRVMRSLAFRIEGLKQQLNFARATNDNDTFNQIQARIDKVVDDYHRMGFKKLVNRKGKVIGVGQQLPSFTQLVETIFDEEPTYRLLSGMVHAHPWVLSHFGFRVEETDSRKYLTQNMKAFHVIFLSLVASKAFIAPIRKKAGLYWIRC